MSNFLQIYFAIKNIFFVKNILSIIYTIFIYLFSNVLKIGLYRLDQVQQVSVLYLYLDWNNLTAFAIIWLNRLNKIKHMEMKYFSQQTLVVFSY